MYKMPRFIRIPLVAIAVTFAVLAQPLLQGLPGVNVAHADETQNLKLVLDTVDSAQGREKKLEYWSGEIINMYPQFAVSGTGVNIPNAKLELCVPKSNYLEKPGFVDSSQAQGSTRRETDDAWCIDYSFDKITGGLKTAVPFSFNFRNHVTPTGITVTPTWKLIGEDGRVIKEDSVTFTAKAADKFTPSKRTIWSWDRHLEKPRGAFYSEADFTYREGTDDTHTPANWNRVFQYELCVKPAGNEAAPSGTGRFQPTKVKFVDKLPEDATLAERSLSEGWTYDESSHSATWEGKAYFQNECGGYYKQIFLKFNNARVYTDATKAEQLKHVNTMVATVDPGLSSEQQLPETTAAATFRPVLYVPPKPEGRNEISKWVVDRNFTYYNEKFYRGTDKEAINAADEQKDLIRWQIDFSNINNKLAEVDGTPAQGSGVKSYYREFRDYGLDPRMYYNSFRLDETAGYSINDNPLSRADWIAKFNAVSNVLYGVKDDDSEVELARDVKMGQRIEIGDQQRQYKALRLAFTTPLELDNVRYRLLISAYPVAEEVAKWKAEGYQGQQSYINDADGQVSLGSPDASVVRMTEPSHWRWDNDVYINGITPTLGMFTGSQWGLVNSDMSIVYENCENKRDSSGENLTVATITPQNCGRVRNYHVNSNVSGRWGALDEPIRNVRHLVVLPPGVNYLRTTGSWMYGQALPKPIEPTVIQNFKNSGRTALVYNYGDLESRYGNGDWSSLGVRSNFDLDTTLYAEMNPKVNLVEYYTLWDNNDLVKPAGNTWNSNTYTDQLDLDDDGNTDESFMRSEMRIVFTPPAELVPKKSVSLDGHGWSLSAPAQDLGGSVFYRYSVANTGL
ncbi:hypothetical protein, partial [Schaalia sp. lx-260]|uniref:hypothetical protein n=1 Tax=Schaalia sp. lx-260 TaxID=2899082 RepID=UPI001E4ED951